MAKSNKAEKPWERQKGESEKAYEAFDIYCKLGKKRTISEVGRQLGKSRDLMNRWRVRWNWKERVREYDNALIERDFEEQKEAVRKMHERQIQTAMLLQAKAVKALDALNIENVSPQDILRFITEGAKLEMTNRVAESVKRASEQEERNGTSSLAESILEAYKKRKGDNDDT